MAKNRLEDLRNHLFETLEALKDPEKPMEVERAHAVAEVAHAIINSAKLELRFEELHGQKSSSPFIVLPTPAAPPQAPQITNGTARHDDKVKCNQCDAVVSQRFLGAHKKDRHPASTTSPGIQ